VSEPLLSVAIVVGALRERAQRVARAVAEQDVAGDLELVIVDLEPDREPIEIPAPLRAAYVRLPGGTISRAKAEAVRRASAPAVAFLEDHCYPRPGWASALIEAHRGPWAAVGYAFENANPDTWLSRSSMVSDYGIFVEPQGGVAEFISGNNVSYRRDAVLGFGDRLEALLMVDYNVHSALRARGERLFIEPRAVAAHENYTRMSDLGNANRSYCRAMAANRARGWSRARRMFYAAVVPVAAPAIKFVRLGRAVAARPRALLPTLSALPVILGAYAYSVAGEARGYLEESAEAAEAEFLIWELATERAGRS
jgi:hypothetical protein